jgi:mono/diheme cytochrome c family protein
MPHRWIRIGSTAIPILAALMLIDQPRADGAVLPEAISAGHRLAAAWCKECHAIEPIAIGGGKNGAPDFVRIANLPSTTELSLKVFLRSDHNRMPNFIIQPADAEDLVQYILSLKRN